MSSVGRVILPRAQAPVSTRVPYARSDKASALQLIRHLEPLCPSPPVPLPPLCPATTELPPAVAPGPFSALFPTRFILDDSALYLSDKCEVESLDLRRGGQGLGRAPPTLRVSPRPILSYTYMHVCAHVHTAIPQILPLVMGRAGAGWTKTMRTFLLRSASDYVCVLDIDLLELVIKTWKGSTESRLVSLRPPGEPAPCQAALVFLRGRAISL